MDKSLFNGDSIAHGFFEDHKYFATVLHPNRTLFGFTDAQEQMTFYRSYLQNQGLITVCDLDTAYKFYKEQPRDVRLVGAMRVTDENHIYNKDDFFRMLTEAFEGKDNLAIVGITVTGFDRGDGQKFVFNIGQHTISKPENLN